MSELLDLRLADVNLAAGYAFVRGGKPGRDRVVYLTPPLVQALKRYLSQRAEVADHDEVFILHQRSPCADVIRKHLDEYAVPLGLRVTPHQLRHTMATRLVNQGMPIQSLRKLLGHQRLDTTQLYAQIYDQTLYHQFTQAMGCLEGIAVAQWPGADLSDPQRAGGRKWIQH